MPRCVTDTDRHVSFKVKEARKAARLTQTQLAEALGVRFQQVQKYEAGTDRMSAGVLKKIADALGVPVGVFFEEPGEPLPAVLLSLAQAKQALAHAAQEYAEALQREAVVE
jgi:transcriptional regulator with XRE-family HTH domain